MAYKETCLCVYVYILIGIIEYIYKHILIYCYPGINSFFQDFLDSGRIKIILKCHTL